LKKNIFLEIFEKMMTTIQCIMIIMTMLIKLENPQKIAGIKINKNF